MQVASHNPTTISAAAIQAQVYLSFLPAINIETGFRKRFITFRKVIVSGAVETGFHLFCSLERVECDLYEMPNGAEFNKKAAKKNWT